MKLYDDNLIYNLDDFSISLKLQEVDNNNEVIIDVNPNTFDNIYKYIIILFICLISIIIFIIKRKKILLILLFILIGITSYVYALEDIVLVINFSSNIVHIDTNKFDTLVNEDLGIAKDNIGNIYFVSREDVPDNYEGSFDISVFDNNKVT